MRPDLAAPLTPRQLAYMRIVLTPAEDDYVRAHHITQPGRPDPWRAWAQYREAYRQQQRAEEAHPS